MKQMVDEHPDTMLTFWVARNSTFNTSQVYTTGNYAHSFCMNTRTNLHFHPEYSDHVQLTEVKRLIPDCLIAGVRSYSVQLYFARLRFFLPHKDGCMAAIYSGTPLNGHPRYDGQFWKYRLSFHSLQYLSNPWIMDTPLLRITDSFRGPNCTQMTPI